MLLNGLPISRIGDMIGQIKSVMFSPEDLDIIKAGPSQRRRFMDLDRCQMKKSYFYELNTYNHVLEQRNHLLKLMPAKGGEDTLFIWDEKLSEAAQPIMAERRRFVSKLSPLCERVHDELSGGRESLKAIYEPSVMGEEEELKEKLLSTLRPVSYTHLGCLFDFNDGLLTVAALDTVRLAVRTVETETGGQAMKAIIPRCV